MVTSRHIVGPQLAVAVEEHSFPDLPEHEKRALLESLDQARSQIEHGESRLFDPDTLLNELKKKYSSR
jgi:hypothetical protein